MFSLEKNTPLLIMFAVIVAFIVGNSFVTGVAEADTASSTEPTTVTLQISKVISPEQFPGNLDESDFSFSITGNGVSETISHGETVELPVGEYSITESGPASFDPGMWTVLWAGDLCVGENISATLSGTIVVEESDLNKYSVVGNPARCNAENQYKPGRVIVHKEVVGTSTSPANFSFSVNRGDEIAFDEDGSNEVTLAAGSYSIVEASAPGYTTTYSDGCSGTIDNTDLVSCTITNTYDDDNGGGGGDTTPGCTDPEAQNYNPDADVDDNSCTYDNGGGGGGGDTYKLEGYVWHDENENGEWETDEEDPLEDWMVILGGDENATTTTNSEGYYSFEVDAGTYTLSEVVQTDWSQTFPSSPVTYTVVVPEEEENEEVALMFPLNLFINVTHAAVIDVYGDFNFGNVQFGTGGGGGNGGSGGGGGGSSSGSSGGSSGSGGSGTPQVLGDQVTAVPTGAPNAGFGGANSLWLNVGDWFASLWHMFRPAR